MKRLFKYIAFTLIVCVLLSGCGGDNGPDVTEPSPTPTADAPTKKPLALNGDTLRIATNGSISFIDPFIAPDMGGITMIDNIYDSLINITPTGEIQPLVAESFTIGEDGKEYTFFLRRGVTFHNRNAVTASDVVYSATRMKQTEKADIAAIFDKAEVIDDYTVKFTLPKADASFLAVIAKHFAIYDKSAVDAGGAFYGSAPVGCGPYRFSERDGNWIKLEAYDGYYGDPPVYKTLEFTFIKDAAAAFEALKNEEIDLCSYIPEAFYAEVNSSDNLKLYTTQSERLLYLALNVQSAPWQDSPTLRQAVSRAIDREKIVLDGFNGLAVVAKTYINSRYRGYSSDLDGLAMDFDLNAAKALAADAGFTVGSVTLSTTETYERQAGFIKDMLSEIGVNVNIEVLSSDALHEKLTSGDVQAVLTDISNGVDASAMGALLAASGTLNIAKYASSEVDGMISEGISVFPADDRNDVYYRLFKRAMTDMPYVPICFPDTVICGRSGLSLDSMLGHTSMKCSLITAF